MKTRRTEIEEIAEAIQDDIGIPGLFSGIYREFIMQIVTRVDEAHRKELRKAAEREKHWQEVAGKLASAGNAIYYILRPSPMHNGPGESDLETVEELHQSIIIKYLEMNEDE